MTDLATVLRLADAGHSVTAISETCQCSQGHVYAVLREHRPDRVRSARTPTSAVPLQVRALLAGGASVQRVVFLLGVSRQYVYRCAPVGRGEAAEQTK